MTAIRSLALGMLVLAAWGNQAQSAPLRRGFWWRPAFRALVQAAETENPAPAALPYAAQSRASAQAGATAELQVVAILPAAPAAPNTATTTTTAVLGGWAVQPTTQVVDSGTVGYSPMAASYSYSSPAAATATTPSYQYNALVNMGDGPYASAGTLTMGGPRPWYESPVVTNLYGGTPTPEDRAAFTSTVLARVEDAFNRSGVDVSLTSDPAASAAHTLSVVSNAYHGYHPDAIGISAMGGDGFSFIDKLTYAQSVDELQWAVAHNVAHELMHAFDVAHHDETGQFLDSAIAPWETLVNPETKLSAAAVADLLSKDFLKRYDTGMMNFGAQGVSHPSGCNCTAHAQLSPVPEPATWAMWILVGVACAGGRRFWNRTP